MAPDYIRTCVALLERTGAWNVGGRFLTLPRGSSPMVAAIATVTSNWFGVGGSACRIRDTEDPADSAGYGAYPREIFARIGYFDERLVRNQDNEFNSRIRRQVPHLHAT
jgi:succinoglycan biosynthesis protein ExoA